MGEHAGEPDASVLDALSRMTLLRTGDTVRFTPLAGGVASDIWKVETGGRTFCVKRALARLRVRDEWLVTVERNAYEVGWIETARRLAPGSAPRILGADREANLFAMEWLPPDRFPVWKSLLMDGSARVEHARAVGETLAAIHSGTANRPEIAERFRTDAIFRDIRLYAYLGAAARRHPELSEILLGSIETTARTRLALVHGDVSPKNILMGTEGQVFLDAECAWYGDPAFDIAFCLNHLLLKCLWRPASASDYLGCFTALSAAYLGRVDWEPEQNIEARAAALLPGLLLARVDGKSPVEYLTGEEDKATVRRAAERMLRDRPARLGTVREQWREVIA